MNGNGHESPLNDSSSLSHDQAFHFMAGRMQNKVVPALTWCHSANFFVTFRQIIATKFVTALHTAALQTRKETS